MPTTNTTTYEVYIPDPPDPLAIDQFIKDSNLLLVGVMMIDVSDFSEFYDEMYSYSFASEKDALMFSLRWKK